MSSLRATGCVVLLTAAAASCWDGALDPVRGAPDGGDPDADTDADTDTATDSDTGVEPADCSVSVPIYDPDNEMVICTYTAPGTCVEDAAECVGCAWAEAVVAGCSDGQSCCIGEAEFQPCTTWMDWSWECGYAEDTCPEGSWTVWSTEPSELPVCPGGAFCCS